jgi:carbamoyltransferase
MAVLGIASNGTDSAGCIVSGGRLVCAAEEERFSRIKGDGSFPVNAIRWCLDSTGLGAADIEHIAVSWNYDRYAPASSAQDSVVGHYQALAESGIRVDWTRLDQHVAKFQPTRFIEELRTTFPRLVSTPVMFFNHHDSHAASSFFFSGFDRSLEGATLSRPVRRLGYGVLGTEALPGRRHVHGAG